MTNTLSLQKKTKCIAFLSAVLFGLVIHLFGLVNTIHNYDDICMQPMGVGTTVSSGRWFLGLLGKAVGYLFGTYNLPLVNGIVFLCFLGVSVVLLVELFNIRSSKIAALLGLIVVSFPTATSTLFFKYTAPYYGFAILLSVLAAKILIEYKYGFVISVLLSVLSLSIYQAYLPITVSILVIFLIKKSLDDDAATFRNLMVTGFYYCLCLLISVIVYKLSVNISVDYMKASNESFALNAYQGINEMGNLSLSDIPALLLSSMKSFLALPFRDYCGLAQTRILRIAYPLLNLISLFIIARTLIVKKKTPGIIGITALLCLLYPVAVNLIVVMCPNSDIYTLMVYSFALVPCTPLLLWESQPPFKATWSKLRSTLKKGLATVLLLMIGSYSFLTNVNYSAMYFHTRQTENYVASLVTQIRMTEGFDADKKWAFIGSMNDPLLKTKWTGVPTYGGNRSAKVLLKSYSRNDWISNYVGYSIPWANEEIETIKATDEFKAMPCWPSEGSIKIIEDIVVVKFQG